MQWQRGPLSHSIRISKATRQWANRGYKKNDTLGKGKAHFRIDSTVRRARTHTRTHRNGFGLKATATTVAAGSFSPLYSIPWMLFLAILFFQVCDFANFIIIIFQSILQWHLRILAVSLLLASLLSKLSDNIFLLGSYLRLPFWFFFLRNFCDWRWWKGGGKCQRMRLTTRVVHTEKKINLLLLMVGCMMMINFQ